jgi:hypothetical protein
MNDGTERSNTLFANERSGKALFQVILSTLFDDFDARTALSCNDAVQSDGGRYWRRWSQTHIHVKFVLQKNVISFEY